MGQLAPEYRKYTCPFLARRIASILMNKNNNTQSLRTPTLKGLLMSSGLLLANALALPAVAAAAEPAAPKAAAASKPLSKSGSATITGGGKKATWKNGKIKMVNGPINRSTPGDETTDETAQETTNGDATEAQVVVVNFKSLDRNRDGRLSLAEMATDHSQNAGYADMDIDKNGSIDDFEYEAHQQRVAQERRWTRNR